MSTADEKVSETASKRPNKKPQTKYNGSAEERTMSDQRKPIKGVKANQFAERSRCRPRHIERGPLGGGE